MSNPFVADKFFKLNPTKVLGEETVKKGRFGNDMVYVKGDISNIQNIDAEPVKVVDMYPDSVQTFTPEQSAIDKVFQTEITKEKVEKVKKLRGVLNPQVTTAKQAKDVQEVYSYAEIDEMYNKSISREEKEAYYHCHPELNYKLLFDEFTYSREQLIEKNLICYEHEKKAFEYFYSYVSGNVNKKLSNLQRDKEKIVSIIGEAQYQKQVLMLQNVKPAAKGFVGNDKIILLPHSNLAKEFTVTELRYYKNDLYGDTTIFNAFKQWLRSLPADQFNKSTYREIIEYYLDNKAPNVSKNLNKEEKALEEKRSINAKQRSKEEGDRLFALFLSDELLPEDQARLSYIWNEKYNSIVEPDLSKIPVCFRISKTFKGGGRPLTLNPTQRQAVAFMMEKKSGLFAYGVGVGKAHLLTSDILTPKGFVKMGDIKLGDQVIGGNGKPTMVTGVFPQGKVPCFEITFSDGSVTSVSSEHLWKVQKIKNRENKNGLWHVMTTQEILNKGLYTKRKDYYFSIPMVEPIHFDEQPLFVDPYVMGCLIADGSLNSVNNGGGIVFTKAEEDIVNKVNELLPESVELRLKKGTTNEYGVSRKSISGKNEVSEEIKELELCCKSEYKFIPEKYLFNSYENRLKLLQGLLDTDGYINETPSKKKSGKKGVTIQYSTSSKQLSKDVVFLVQTFGGNATVARRMPKYTHRGEKRNGRLSYTVTIRLPKGIVPVSSNKQLAKFQEKSKYQPVRFIKSIEPIGNQEAQCISVAAEDHLYVCEDCIVTHNTLASIACASQAIDNNLSKYPCFVVPTNTYDKWIGEIQGFVDKATGVFNHGALPHLPPVQGLYNLNPTIVSEKLKEYSKDEQRILDAIQEAYTYTKEIDSDTISEAKREKINKIYNGISWQGIEGEYNIYLEDSKAKNPKKLSQYVAEFLKEEYNYKIYELGTVKKFPEGTIFVITEVGLQRLGVSESEKDQLAGKLYEILSQGEKTADKESGRDIASLQAKIEQNVSSSLKNAKLNISDFGIDFACFDEAHYYKKLFTYVKGQVTGETQDWKNGGTKNEREKSKYELKSGQYPSSRALSAFVLSHYVQSKNQNRNVIQLTATPFTNSPLEVFSMLTLTNYKALEEASLSNMIDFFDTFMRITYDIKYTPQKTVVKDISLTGYNNLSQLRQLIYNLMDKKDEGANIQRPTKLIYPSIEKGIETTFPLTAEQEELMKEVKKYLNGSADYDAICKQAMMDEIEGLDFDGLDDEVLVAEWERSTGKEFEGEREGLTEAKRDQLIKAIKDNRIDGIEMGEEDLSEDESLGVRILKGLSMMRQITLSPYLYYKACRKASGADLELPNYKDYVESSPKFKYVMGCISSVINWHKSNGTKISGQVIYMNAGVEYFTLLKQYLVKVVGLNENQVGIVSGGMSKSAKESIKNKFLSGDILVLIGSSTISVGVDLQNNATVLYNCYYDWNPTDAQQIEGRIWRQGNRFANVRIVYPMCYNSADPVLFEYLNSKTLRINEIWNRSSTIQELDLRDFNPKELQKKLITDPEEKAEFEILMESEVIESQIIYYENRVETISKAVNAYEGFNRLKPVVIGYLSELAAKKNDITRTEAVKNQKEKINEIVEKYSDTPDKMASEITKYKSSRYDHENDPEGKYSVKDYTTATSEEIYADAAKYLKIIDDWSWKDDEIWGEALTDNKYKMRGDLIQFRGDYKEMSAAEDKVLKPLGLSFETATNPFQEISAKLTELKEQLSAINDGKYARVKRLKEEMLANRANLKTVQDRIKEFASANDKLLSELAFVGENKPAEIEPPKPEEVIIPSLDIKLKEIEKAAKPVIEKVVVEPEPVVEPVIPEPAPEPVKEEVKASNKREIAQNQINAINLSINYLKGETLAKAKARLKSLELSIKYL